MKRISTRIFQLSILAALFSLAFSASAEEYKSMIRYDRVWEHIYIHWSDTRAYYVKFDGPEEFNGKTYHRLVAFKEVKYTYDYDGQAYTLDINDDYFLHEGYLREEDGKVYILVASGVNEWGNPFMEPYVPGLSLNSPFTLDEILIYDFTLKEGDTYQGWYSQGIAPYAVDEIEHVEIDGEDHRLFRVYIDEDEEWCKDVTAPIVEGIGIASYGCLTTINFLDLPTCPCMNHIFNRVLSTDGRVLYRSEDGCADIPVDNFFGMDGIAEITDMPESDAPRYDILGRQIADPAPGQLYIQGGHKHIATPHAR